MTYLHHIGVSLQHAIHRAHQYSYKCGKDVPIPFKERVHDTFCTWMGSEYNPHTFAPTPSIKISAGDRNEIPVPTHGVAFCPI